MTFTIEVLSYLSFSFIRGVIAFSLLLLYLALFRSVGICGVFGLENRTSTDPQNGHVFYRQSLAHLKTSLVLQWMRSGRVSVCGKLRYSACATLAASATS